jgi:predicted nucleic acid-binding protein
VALAFDRPLVTRNRRHFDHVEQLTCIALAETE